MLAAVVRKAWWAKQQSGRARVSQISEKVGAGKEVGMCGRVWEYCGGLWEVVGNITGWGERSPGSLSFSGTWYSPCPSSCTGEHCEVSARSGRCTPGVCKNGGTCVNLLVGGFKCDCPSGDFEKPYCRVTTRSFPARSFITFRGLRQRFHFTLALS